MLALCLEVMASAPALPQSGPQSHAQEVESAISKLGVGKHVVITIASGESIRGNIAGIGVNSFKFQPDHTETAEQIPYGEVTHIRTGSKRLVWIALGIVAATVVIVIVALARTPSTKSIAK